MLMKPGLTMGDEEDDDDDDDESDDEDAARSLGKKEWSQLKTRANALRHLVSRDPLAADVKITLFASAVFSHRYAEVAFPVPAEYAGPAGIHSLTEALDAAPAMRLLLTGGPAAVLAPRRSLHLVEWLLAPPSQPGAPGAALRALSRPAPAPDTPAPSYVFQVENPRLDERWRNIARGKTVHVAFLGECLDVYHSLVHRGLSSCDQGIRLRRTLKEAMEDSIPGYGLGSSELGSRLRCVAECEIAEKQCDDLLVIMPDGDFLLKDGKLARIIRLYVFQAPWENVKERFSNRSSWSQPEKSSTISIPTTFKLPEFRFEVETSFQYSSSDKCKEGLHFKIVQDGGNIKSSPLAVQERNINNPPSIITQTSQDLVKNVCTTCPKTENNLIQTPIKEQETDKQVIQSDVSSVLDSPKISEFSYEDSLSNGPLYKKIKPLDPLIPSRSEKAESEVSMGSKDTTSNYKKHLSNISLLESDALSSVDKDIVSFESKTERTHDITLQMLQQIIDRLNESDKDSYNFSGSGVHSGSQVVQDTNMNLDKEEHTHDHSSSNGTLESQKYTDELSNSASQERLSKIITFTGAEETEVEDENLSLSTDKNHFDHSTTSSKVLTNVHNSSLSSQRYHDTIPEEIEGYEDEEVREGEEGGKVGGGERGGEGIESRGGGGHEGEGGEEHGGEGGGRRGGEGGGRRGGEGGGRRGGEGGGRRGGEGGERSGGDGGEGQGEEGGEGQGGEGGEGERGEGGEGQRGEGGEGQRGEGGKGQGGEGGKGQGGEGGEGQGGGGEKEKTSYSVPPDRASTASSVATWAESESPSEIKFWEVMNEEEGSEMLDDELEINTGSSQESEELRRDFEKNVLEPIRSSQKGNESGGKRLIILVLQSSPSSGK